MNSIDSSFSIENKLSLVVNDSTFSDVIFVVGVEKQQIYAHKLMLSIASEVFRSMFFGELKEKSDKPILIPDLIPDGFLNVLKYIYGRKQIDFELNELFQTYKAADKYLVNDMVNDLSIYIQKNLSPSNALQIYDQLIRIEPCCDKFLKSTVNYISFETEQVFDSYYFCELDERTLLTILDMDGLTIDEDDLLKNCVKWIDAELVRQCLNPNPRNKQKIFKNLKPYIKFDRIPIILMREIKGIEDLFTDKEKASIFTHFLNKQKIAIDCKTKRKTITISSEQMVHKKNQMIAGQLNSISFLLIANQSSIINNIHTSIDKSIKILQFSIYENEEKIDFNYTTNEDDSTDSNWSFDLEEEMVLFEPNINYKFEFKFKTKSICRLHTNTLIETKSSKYSFKIETDHSHCIDRLEVSIVESFN